MYNHACWQTRTKQLVILKSILPWHLCFFFQSGDISVFETNIRYVGGLLSAYALTGDEMFRDKATHVADKLMPAFKSPTGIPFALINMRTGVSQGCLPAFNYVYLGVPTRVGNEYLKPRII